MVTDKVIAQMEQGIIPWHRPWTGTAGTVNYVTQRPYSLLNQILLGREGEWITFNQLKKLGGRIRKGAKAGSVVFFSPYGYQKEVIKEDGTKVIEHRVIPILKCYNVFHVDDCEGIEKHGGERTQNELEPVERAEVVIKDYVTREKLTFKNDEPSNRAFYRPSTDEVVVPMLSQYDIVEEYYSTTFHELTHSTMPEHRCNRRAEGVKAAFGGEEYSREELVAELGSAMLCSVMELDCDKAFKNSVAYIQGWLKALKNDNKMVVWAASRAEKAARFIMGEKDGEDNG